MKRLKGMGEQWRRGLSFFLAALLGMMVIVPYLPVMPVRAGENQAVLTSAGGDTNLGHKLYCIDKGGLAYYGIAAEGDVYEPHRPSTAGIYVPERDRRYIFWGLLTLRAARGDEKAGRVLSAVRSGAAARKMTDITSSVTEEDLKALIYLDSVRAKYPWLETVADNSEEYMRLGGLLSSGTDGTGTVGGAGKKIPEVLAGASSLQTALPVDGSTMTISFDPSGADADFIRSVPLEFSEDNGATFSPVPTGGWTYTKTDTSIIFSNAGLQPSRALIRFNVSGTAYASGQGTYASEMELLENCLQIWECVKCSGTHTGGTPPLSSTWVHQRMAWLELDSAPIQYFAFLGGGPAAGDGQARITFRVYRHEEEFTGTYNVQLYKYDHETGEALKGSRFALYERFDDRGKVSTERDGALGLYEGGEPYAGGYLDSPALWEGFRKVSSLVTDENGRISQTIRHRYQYDKTFCNGHPAPVFASVPASEEDDEGNILNQGEIDAAQTENRETAKTWLACVSACEEKSEGDFSGVHFHWVMTDVDAGAIEEIAVSGGDEGGTPNGGNTAEPGGDASYRESGCQEDCRATYDKFISMRYSYAFSEYQARDGYIRHGVHADDLPIEIITTDASEYGANASFSGEYSNLERLEAGVNPVFADMVSRREKSMQKALPAAQNDAGVRQAAGILPEKIFKEGQAIFQKIIEVSPVERMRIGTASEAGEEGDDGPAADKEALDLPLLNAANSQTATASDVQKGETKGEGAEDDGESGEEEEGEEEEGEEEEEKEEKEQEEGERPELASASGPSFRWSEERFSFRSPKRGSGEEWAADIFTPAYEAALVSASVGEAIVPGPEGNFSHCNDADGEKNAWRVYDHRTEGEIHINKKDMDLAAAESARFDAYGISQGDAALEGAVYGLFAAEDIMHPDGKTGTVYKANDLVAVASTDRDGNASFMVNTEPPGHSYDYAQGKSVENSWASRAPENLYISGITYDDYTEDGRYVRTYYDNAAGNGNCWVGRPLLMGDYYVKELSRSEGYELSVSSRQNNLTNLGQNLDARAPEHDRGYALIAQQMFADEQTDERGDGAKPNEIFFSARSRDTENQRYDLVLNGLPKEVKVYRKEIGKKRTEVMAGTGEYELVPVNNPDGTPMYVTAEHDFQYPKYNDDGSLMTREIPAVAAVSRVQQVPVRYLDEAVVASALRQADGVMTPEENEAMLEAEFTEEKLLFVKAKAEKALRENGKSTPWQKTSDGYEYSDVHAGVYDSGVWEGDIDVRGLSGVAPGNPAVRTVYGSPVNRISIAKRKEDQSPLTVGDAIVSVLDYYNQNAFYSFGGIHAVEDTGERYVFSLYAGVSGNPENFMVLGSDPVSDSVIYHAADHELPDGSGTPRYVYASYSNNPAHDAFGTYEDYREGVSGSLVIGSAVLVTDAVTDGQGNLRSKLVTENVYYKQGEPVYDHRGNPVRAYEYREILKKEEKEVEEVRWREIPVRRQEDGVHVISVEAAYTDTFGAAHTNAGEDQIIDFKAVLKENRVTLSAEDADLMGDGFFAGGVMGSASYYVHVKRARAKAYLDYLNMDLAGENSYIVPVSLDYPGQETVLQDAGTGDHPLSVLERPIRQKIKAVKDIRVNPDGTYAHNTYDYKTVKKEVNFRFKAYLKSNLERLYRAENGSVTWLDRNGNEIPYEKMLGDDFPAILQQDKGRTVKAGVRKIFTKTAHNTESSLTSANGNNVLADYGDPETENEEAAMKTAYSTAIAEGGAGVFVNSALYSFRGLNINAAESARIRGEQNKGYTRILETAERRVESGGLITVQDYNYDKFFDALETANVDKWDDKHQTYTSWKPLGNEASRSEYAENNAKASDMVRQFAVTWYLKDETAKLVRDNGHAEDEAKGKESGNTYTQKLYDEALNEALEKAYNYLKPFFAYDLDEIYAVPWDEEAGGGSDGDRATLSADHEAENYTYGISGYLPYGVYVVAEQQPKYVGKDEKAFNDFANKHYKTDQPKEITVPSVYEKNPQADEVPHLSEHYRFEADMSLDDQAKDNNYLIRFGEEWTADGGDQRQYVIRAHNNDGNFEVYKYGLEPDKLTGAITYGGGSYEYGGFSITQEPFDPLKDYYHPIHRDNGGKPLTKEKGANENSHYFADDGNGEIQADGGGSYRPDAIEERYHYGSVSEQAGIGKYVRFERQAEETPDNGGGAVYRSAAAVQGILTAYDGLYGPMLVPYTVTEPGREDVYVPEVFAGYADGNYRNTFYAARLRIEKLDSETHENLLHDGALFMIYKARRDQTTGEAKFWEEDTVITGTEEFLKAMNAVDIAPVRRGMGAGELYSGTVRAGTPICEEKDKVVLSDACGNDVGQFEAFSTTGDLSMKQEETNAAPNEYRRQTAGYLKTPQPLGAGVYVLCEIPPMGYVRTAPVAVEIYSDEVSYYKEGNRDKRVLAAVYEEPADGVNGNKNKPQDTGQTAQIYVENTPIKLKVGKIKPKGDVTFRVGGRVEGSLTEIGGNPELEYAYADGRYLGYAYEKGTLERLKALKDAGERVEIVYENGQFAGYGYVTRTRDTDDDENPYVAGAKMTLFDAIELTPSGDSEDFAYEGLTVNRSNNGNVREMFVKKGYAGRKTEMVKEVDASGREILTDYVTGVDADGMPVTEKGYVWKEGTVERPDTDILYYDLDSLSLTWTERVDGRRILFGWDKNHRKTAVEQLESDKANYGKSDREPSIYAFKGGQAYLEFVGGDLMKLSYSAADKRLKGDFAGMKFINRIRQWKMGDGTLIYHLDRDGNRDALVDPVTGMAYVLEPQYDEAGVHAADRVLVWPVNVARDEHGNVISRDKIATSRIATVRENQDGYEDGDGESAVLEPVNQNPEGQVISDSEKPGYEHRESGYINGTWKAEKAEESHQERSEAVNKNGQNMNEEILSSVNNGDLLKYMSPVYDEHGLVLYYQRSLGVYDKGTELYDRNGDFVRYKDSDNLEEYNRAAYALDARGDLYDGRWEKEIQSQDRLYHRKGESYILENTWMTSDKTPNDPFDDEETEGQADLIKRIPAGTYILEELAVPAGKGYTKAVPTGVTVEEDAGVKCVTVTDDTTKIYIEKTDAPESKVSAVLDMDRKGKDGAYFKAGESGNMAVQYDYRQISGAEIALYPARRVPDPAQPKGYRLEKAGSHPYVMETTDSRAGRKETAILSWTTGERAVYLEGIPAGDYILEEKNAPSGFVRAAPAAVEIRPDQEIHQVLMRDDHTKLAFWKYALNGTEKRTLPGAGFSLYAAKLGEDGAVEYENGIPQYDEKRPIVSWVTNDATDYTDTINLKDYPNTSGKSKITGFTEEFEAMYEDSGIEGKSFGWSVRRTAKRDSAESNVWVTEDGNRVIVNGKTVTFPPAMDRENRDGFKAAYAKMSKNQTAISWTVLRNGFVESVECIDASVAGGRADRFPETARILIRIGETGEYVLADARYNGMEFVYSYKFDYRKLDISPRVNTWLTADGMRRVDYLPAGERYVLVETEAPSGYDEAKPRLVEVREMSDVQLHDVLNERRALLISKISSVTGKELAGNQLALYRADEKGELTETDEYLIEVWTSGKDGLYTETDVVNGLIPDGFVEGDVKPHYIYDLEDGVYFLTERLAADYYTAMAPIRIDYTGGKSLRIVKAVNEPVRGKLTVRKTDGDGNLLNGAVFELSAFTAEGQMVDGFPRKLSDMGGMVMVRDLPVGEVMGDGTVKPYEFQLKELEAPAGYAVNHHRYSFRFDPGRGSYGKDLEIGMALHELEVKNERTRIYIEKKDLTHLNDKGTDGAFVDGAVMALYKVRSTAEDGSFSYGEEDLVEQWVTSQSEGKHLIEGLIAGQSYVLEEKKAPAGYHLMKPVIVTISEDGRAIRNISNQMSMIRVDTVKGSPENPDTDSIAAVTVRGRRAVRTDIMVADESGREVLSFAGTGEEQVITEESGLRQGEVYTFSEHTIYSDGSSEMTAKLTRRVHFADGKFVYSGREAVGTELTIADAGGTAIAGFVPTEEEPELTIENGICPENPKITLRSRSGKAGAPLEEEQPVIGTITYYNPSPLAQDVSVKAILGGRLKVLDSYGGTREEDGISWTIHDVGPYSQRSVSFAASIEEEKGKNLITPSYAALTAEVSAAGRKIVSEKTVPVMRGNSLTIYNELTGSGKEIFGNEESEFTVRLWDERGSELAGIYSYSGSRKGALRSGDSIFLAGNEFVMIDPANFRNCRYEVVRKENQTEIKGHDLTGSIRDFGSAAWFSRSVQDTSERQIFSKNGTYFLTERTLYSDGEERVSDRFSFTLNELAGISAVGGYDRETEVSISKTDLATGEELPGNRMELMDEKGGIVKQWISGDEPYVIAGLIPGASYTLKEIAPADGYSYAEEITFTVNEDGTVDQVLMENKPTHVVISKKAITGGQELPGAHLEIVDQNGQLAEQWISGETPHEIIGKLTAGAVYTLRETIPADGFVIAEEITFTVSRDGSVSYVEMRDDTTKVQIHKNVFAEPAKAVAGSVLQILNEDKTPAMYDGQKILITTGETFTLLEKILKAGNTYWLHEVKPAPGYAYAEDVKFTVSSDGRVDVVIMEDKPTEVQIAKTDITGETELPGCKMQLTDESGIVVEQWISGDRPHVIRGVLKAGEEYRLSEVNPAPGYAYARDVTFTVNMDGTVNQVQMRDDTTKVEVTKTDRGGRPLRGAQFEILDKNGAVAERWISAEQAHRMEGLLIAGETYTLREVKAPPGYSPMDDVEFTVSRGGEVLEIAAQNVKTGGGGEDDSWSILLKKVDGEGNALPGASFEVTGASGRKLSLMREDASAFKVTLSSPQTITVRELSAPDGYEVLENSYQIRIPGSGDAQLLNGDDVFYQDAGNSFVFYAVNEKKPDTPEEPVLKSDRGMILAEYDRDIYGEGRVRCALDGVEYSFVKTGDDFPTAFLDWLLAASLSGLAGVICVWFKNRKGGRGPKSGPPRGGGRSPSLALWMLFLAVEIFAASGCSADGKTPATVSDASISVPEMEDTGGEPPNVRYREQVYVSDGGDTGKNRPDFEKTMEEGGVTWSLECVDVQMISKRQRPGTGGNIKIVQSAPFADDEKNHMPEKEIHDGEKTWYLSSSKTVDTVLDARKEPVFDVIVYEAVLPDQEIPQSVTLRVTDPVTGEELAAAVPLKEKQYGEERWTDDFQFPVTVVNCGADTFDLNGREVLLSDEAPLKGYEGDLLAMIGVSGEDYIIDEIQWDGEPYADGETTCRKLLASGRMRVSDCTATYEGVADLPAVSAKIIQSVYTDRPPGEEGSDENYVYTMKAVAQYRPAAGDTELLEQRPAALVVRTAIAVSLMFLAALALGAVILVRRRYGKGRDERGKRRP